MTIVHVLEPFATGVTSAIAALTEQLSGLEHVVVHGARTGADTQEAVRRRFPPGVRFIPWIQVVREISPSKDVRALGELMGILGAFRDTETVVHLHSSKAGFLGRLACALLRIRPVVYTPHGASFIRTDIGPLKRGLFRLLERVGGRFGGVVAGCGPSEAALYSALGKPALCIPNGVALRAPAGLKRERRASFTGLASAQKDPAFFNRVALALPDHSFCWIGDGPLRGKLSAPNITVTGWTGREAVAEELERSEVFLSTAAWEGLPYGVLEAMNASCALLLRDVPGNRDLVRPGENGYLFRSEGEAAELLSRMLADSGGLRAMGRKSRELAEAEYSVEKMAASYGRLYEALLRGES
ncbi:MAG: glycosyltransferase [Spirochaetaceae bacterium]|jgi:glycosyltransferase involved in cell wall biosynthesis|nr:glycosyltransferase [Spirochaetaceae bacterium]